MRIAVVGGGFAGLMATYTVTGLGAEVDLYEEHDRVGYPPHCTGIVSERVVEGIGGPARENVQAVYKGFRAATPTGSLQVQTKRPVYKLDRVGLEQSLMREAERRGANILLNTRVKRVTPGGEVRVGGAEKKYDLIILAEGSAGRLRRNLGLHHKPLASRGLNVEVDQGSGDTLFEVFFSADAVGPGFAWRVPTPGRTIIGALVVGGSPRGAIKEVYGVDVVRGYGGRVLHGPPHPKPVLGRILLLGDAAAHNKPLTGGGLYPVTEILREASILAQDASLPEALARATSIVGRRLRKQYYLARILLENPHLTESLITIAAETGLDTVLDGKVDYDYHDELPRLVLAKPGRALTAALRLARRDPLGALGLVGGWLRGLFI